MNYNKEVFKKYYGRVYISRLKGTILTTIIAILLICFFSLLNIQVGVVFAFLLCLSVFICVFVLLPIFFSTYTKKIRISERQKQWINNNELHFLNVLDDGYVWGVGHVEHKMKYVVSNISKIEMNNQYIIVYGNVVLVETYNGISTEKYTNNVKIPRNFTNEELILNLRGK